MADEAGGGGNAAPEKAASILWPPSHTQGGRAAIRQWRYCTVTTNNFTQLYISCQGQVRPYRQHCNILEFLYSYKGSISISAVTRYKVLHLAMLSHVQHEGGVASPLTCQAL